MNKDIANAIADQILNILTSGYFENWYQTNFEAWVRGDFIKGDPEFRSKEQIREEVKEVFRLI